MARRVGALGQPDPVGVAAEVLAVVLGGHVDLRPDRLGHRVHEREEAVGRAAGDDLQLPGVPVLAEGAHQVRAVDVAEDPPDVGELVQVEPGEVVEVRLPALRPLHLAPRQLDQAVEVAVVPADQQLVGHHRDERRRQRHGQPVVDAVLQQAVEDADDRDVGLGERLEEPVLLEERRVLGVPDVREVGVEDGAPVPGGHGLPYRRKVSLAPPGRKASLAPPRAARSVSPRPRLGGPVDGRRVPGRVGDASLLLGDAGGRGGRGRQLAGVAVAHPPARALRRGADPRGHHRVALRQPAELARGEDDAELGPVGAPRGVGPHVPPPRARRQEDVARPSAHGVDDPQGEAREGEGPLAEALAEVLHRGGADVPVREDPLGVAHQEAHAVHPVRLGEEEPLLLEDLLRQLAGQVLGRADLVFLAEPGHRPPREILGRGPAPSRGGRSGRNAGRLLRRRLRDDRLPGRRLLRRPPSARAPSPGPASRPPSSHGGLRRGGLRPAFATAFFAAAFFAAALLQRRPSSRRPSSRRASWARPPSSGPPPSPAPPSSSPPLSSSCCSP